MEKKQIEQTKQHLAPLEKTDLEQRLEKKLNAIYSFNNSIKNIKEKIIYFKDKNHKSKKNCKNYKTPRNIRISRHIWYYWSNVNFYNFTDYWYWFGCVISISWYCQYFITR